jgi:hypothetical protein
MNQAKLIAGGKGTVLFSFNFKINCFNMVVASLNATNIELLDLNVSFAKSK